MRFHFIFFFCLVSSLLGATPTQGDVTVTFNVSEHLYDAKPGAVPPRPVKHHINVNGSLVHEPILDSQGEFVIFDIASRIAAYFDKSGSQKQEYLNAELEITYLSGTKTINNFICNKAKVKLGDQWVKVYFTREIKGKTLDLFGLDGFPLQYEIPVKEGIKRFHVKSVIEASNQQLFQPFFDLRKELKQSIQNTKAAQLSIEETTSHLTTSTSIDDMLDGRSIFAARELISGRKLMPWDYSGRVIVLNFWFTACRPCIRELPRLNELKKKYSDQDVLFLSINYESKEKVEDFLRVYKFYYEHVADADDIVKAYEVNRYPTHIVIDQGGEIALRETGFTDETYHGLLSTINRLLVE